MGNLRNVVLADGRTIEYVIDGQNRRVAKKVDGTLVAGWLYADQHRIVAEFDGTGAVTAQFVYASLGNVPDYMIRSGIAYRIISDHLGSPRAVVQAATGEVAQTIGYDEFGVMTGDTNPGFQPFGFAGGLHDRDTGLVRFGARDYDPVTGRWTAKDPIGFGATDSNLYEYSFADPVDLIDPTGLDSITQDPLVRQYFYDLWRTEGFGKYDEEHAGWITRNPKTQAYGCVRWPFNHVSRHATWKGPIPINMVGQAHTHPASTSPKPSTGGDENNPTDDYTARTHNFSIYTISREGIWKIDPKGKITQEEDSTWSQGISAKTCAACKS
jgi:RHS repeat-associated protein